MTGLGTEEGKEKHRNSLVVVEIAIWGNWYEKESDKYVDKFIEPF